MGFGLSSVMSSDYERGTIVGESTFGFRNYDMGMEGPDGLAVRPVVILKTDIPVGTIKKSEDQSEEEPWEYTKNLGV